MDIVHVASEFTSIIKVGGLGDVVSSLSKELAKTEHQIEVLLPKYDCIEPKVLASLEKDSTIDGVKITLIDLKEYFHRGVVYGEKDDSERFAQFSKAVYDHLKARPKLPDILHLHDWQTSLLALLMPDVKKVITLHNLQHQGLIKPKVLTELSLDGKALLPKLHDPKHHRAINLLKTGIIHADIITTVSPTYAKEILGKQGYGLETVLKKYPIHGILNGLDTDFWNPATDPLISYDYSSSNVQEGKKTNLDKVEKQIGVNGKARPIVCAITRLVEQKGPRFIEKAIELTLDQGGVFLLLAGHPEKKEKKRFEKLQKKIDDPDHFFVYYGFDERLAHLIYAASDMIIVPSLFEPCGLTQMIAMRYGTIPIVHQTGGLADTVHQENGFTYPKQELELFEKALTSAFDLFENDPNAWMTLIKNGMQTDFSWRLSTQKYLELY